MCLHKCVDQKGSAAALVVNRSAGITPEVDLRNVLYADKEEQGIHRAFETQARFHQISKTGLSMVPQKSWCPPIFKKKSRCNSTDFFEFQLLLDNFLKSLTVYFRTEFQKLLLIAACVCSVAGYMFPTVNAFSLLIFSIFLWVPGSEMFTR